MLLDKSIRQLSEGLQKKKFSSVDLVNEAYGTMEKINPSVNACITLRDKKEALDEAAKCDATRSEDSSPLFGIPFVLKDSYVTKGIRTTAASNILKDYIPQYSATVYKKLVSVGAILLAKMNMDAWGHGGSTENTDFGPAHNPYDLSRVAGGSGGGPAVAIATRMAAFAIGEDTGGSIRNPAAWCNITGLKVSYGRVSRYGCIAYASSFDTVGPTAKSVEDCAVVLGNIAGIDPYDATSSPSSVPNYVQQLDAMSDKKVVGLPMDLLELKGLDSEIKQSILGAAKTYESIGFVVKEISMSLLEYVIPMAYLIAPSETSSNLARYDGIRYGNDRTHFTDETMRRIMIGTYALSAGYYDAYYRQAQKVRTLFIREYEKALAQCDALLMPVNPMAPPIIGDLMSDPLQNYLADIYTYSQNPAGLPSLALPCGFTKSGLPIGMQLVGKMFSEDVLLHLGYRYQQKTDWHTKAPKI